MLDGLLPFEMRNPTLLLLLTAAVLSIVISSSRPAAACGQCGDSYAAAGPVPRREPLPASPWIFVAGADLDVSSIGLRLDADGGGAELPFDVEPTGSPDGSVFVRPTEELPAGEMLIVSSNLSAAHYEIGARLDEQAPSAPEVELFSSHIAGACCASVSAQLTATAAADEDGTPPAVLKISLQSPAGERTLFFGYHPGTYTGLGTSEEGCVDSDPLADAGEEVTASVSVIDWAGNESEPVGPMTFVYSRGEPGGCPTGLGCACVSATLKSGGSALALGVLLGVAVLRRRPRTRALDANQT